MIGELFDPQRDELVRPNGPGQRDDEHEEKAGNDSFHVAIPFLVISQRDRRAACKLRCDYAPSQSR